MPCLTCLLFENMSLGILVCASCPAGSWPLWAVVSRRAPVFFLAQLHADATEQPTLPIMVRAWMVDAFPLDPL